MASDTFYTLALEARILNGAMMRLVKGDLDRRLQLHGIGSWLQHATLSLLAEQDMTISELSKRLRVEPATLVPVVDALERDGLAKRGQDPHDRRRTPLSLTSHGNKLTALVPTVHANDAMMHALAGLGEQKSRQYVELLRELMTRISNDADMVKEVTATASRQIAREKKLRRGHNREAKKRVELSD